MFKSQAPHQRAIEISRNDIIRLGVKSCVLRVENCILIIVAPLRFRPMMASWLDPKVKWPMFCHIFVYSILLLLPLLLAVKHAGHQLGHLNIPTLTFSSPSETRSFFHVRFHQSHQRMHQRISMISKSSKHEVWIGLAWWDSQKDPHTSRHFATSWCRPQYDLVQSRPPWPYDPMRRWYMLIQ